jgi:hypothetical protein
MNVQLTIAQQHQAELRAQAARDRLAESTDGPSIVILVRRLVARPSRTRDAVATA